jgi:hypothetical protein
MLRHLIAMILGTLLLIGALGYAWPADARPADGTLVIDNQRFAPVGVSLDGRGLGEVAPDSRRSFRVPAGEHALRIKDRDGQPLMARTVTVLPHGEVLLAVAPTVGELTVRNLTGRDGRLVVDGLDRGPLLAGQERVLRLEAGTVSVQLRQQERVLDSLRAHLRPGERKAWVAQAPATAELRVRNPLPVTIKLRVGSREPVSMEPGEARTLRNQATGPADLVVIGPDGRVLSRDQVRIDPFDGASFMVPVPTAGAVRLVNLGRGTVDVYANGRRIDSISAFDNALIEVPLGTVELSLRDRARGIVLRTGLEIDPFDAITVRCDLPGHLLTVEQRLVAEVDAFIEALRRLAS